MIYYIGTLQGFIFPVCAVLISLYTLRSIERGIGVVKLIRGVFGAEWKGKKGMCIDGLVDGEVRA